MLQWLDVRQPPIWVINPARYTIKAEFSVKEDSKPAYHSWGLDNSAIGKCHCTLRRVLSLIEVDEFGFWVVKGHCISVPPLKRSSCNWLQVFAILLFTIPNNKAGHVIDVAGCCCSWVLLMDGGEQKPEVNEKEDRGNRWTLGNACINWLEVLPLTKHQTKHQSQHPVGSWA